MTGVVKKWGNSAAVRIPSSVVRALHLDVDDAVDIREEDGRIVIEPILKKTFTLEELLSGVTAGNIHEAVDFGEPMGKEVW
jgi:antitoxin MazE